MISGEWLVAGVDEVGRGCLAGPVYAAAVILPEVHDIGGLRDSKRLSAHRREQLFGQIETRAMAWAIGVATVAEIDTLNILNATFLAMQRAVAGLQIQPDLCLVDGRAQPSLPVPVKMVVRGDSTEPAIMAASIIAKVSRDTEMGCLDRVCQGYGFDRNKGYGTPRHLDALRILGASTHHRMSFAPCAEAAAAGLSRRPGPSRIRT